MKARFLLALVVILATAATADSSATKPLAVGIDEHLGQRVPMDLVFRDEAGKPVRLGSLITKPTLLSLVYFECPGICTPLLNGEAEALSELKLKPGKDYNVVTISFDVRDTPATASKKKANYLNLISKPFPPAAWRFLTGDQAAIDRITDAVGFRYQRQGRDFVHAASLYVLAPDGKIVRYLYGTRYLPFDMQMALTEASRGEVGPTINKMLLYCFSYDPSGRKYALNVTRIGGTVVIALSLIFVAVLGVSSRKRARKTGVER